MSVLPHAIDELGTSSGFTLRLLDRGNIGMDALIKAQDQLIVLATQSKKLTGVYPTLKPMPVNRLAVALPRTCTTQHHRFI